MSRRRMLFGITFSLLLAGSWNQLNAGGPGMKYHWHKFWHRFAVDAARNNKWPEPFQYSDRQSVYAFYAAQSTRGWHEHHTLGNVHFSQETNELNRAGKALVHQVVTMSPEQRRTLFVHRSLNQDITEMRVDAVQREVANLVVQGPMPEVVQTDRRPATSPSHYPESVYDAMKQAPRNVALPAAAAIGQ